MTMRTNNAIPGMALLTLLMITASPASGDSDLNQELMALRQMIASLQADYEHRLSELEKRMAASEATAAAAQR